MNTPVFEQFDVMDNEALSITEGGTYYGNGVTCTKKRCTTDWGTAITTTLNNSAINWATDGKAGWHSGGVI